MPPIDPDDPGDVETSVFRPSPAPPPVDRRETRSRPALRPKTRGDEDLLPSKASRGREDGGAGWLERLVLGSVNSGQLALFCRQLGQYLESGVDLLKALGALEKQFAGKALGPVLGRLRQGVKGGLSLSEAMTREPKAFDRMALSMVRVAEAHGGIPELFRQLASHYEARQRLFRQARSAMIHPIIVLTIASLVGYLIVLFVLPGLVELLGRKTGLPLPTQMLVGLSNFMSSIGWWVVPLSVLGGGFLIWKSYRTGPGKAVMDEIALRLPVLGPLLRKIDITRFTRTLSTLLEAGVDVRSSIDLTSQVQILTPYRRAVANLGPAVLDGIELSQALRESNRFGADVIERVVAGEETGRLPETLSHLADDYEEQVKLTVKNLGTLIQPILTIGIGAFVLFIAIAFLMAYAEAIMSLGRGF